MLKIIPIQPYQIADAKLIIAEVAQRIFAPDRTPLEFADTLDEEQELIDVDCAQQIYSADNGLFLVVMDDEKLVGTGAIKRMDSETAELKRLWLLEPYHGLGIGYRVVMQLFQFARECAFKRIVLQTTHHQARAIHFYKQIGFVEIPAYEDDLYDDVSMELKL